MLFFVVFLKHLDPMSFVIQRAKHNRKKRPKNCFDTTDFTQDIHKVKPFSKVDTSFPCIEQIVVLNHFSMAFTKRILFINLFKSDAVEVFDCWEIRKWGHQSDKSILQFNYRFSEVEFFCLYDIVSWLYNRVVCILVMFQYWLYFLVICQSGLMLLNLEWDYGFLEVLLNSISWSTFLAFKSSLLRITFVNGQSQPRILTWVIRTIDEIGILIFWTIIFLALAPNITIVVFISLKFTNFQVYDLILLISRLRFLNVVGVFQIGVSMELDLAVRII